MGSSSVGERDPQVTVFARFVATFRPVDAFLFSLFLLDRVRLFGAFPGGVALTAALVALAIFRKPVYKVKGIGWMSCLFAILVLYLAVSSAYAGVDFEQRLFRIALLLALVLILATGRFHFPSAVGGLIFGAVCINVPAFYAGLTPSLYAPFLTGWFNDKNVAGMWYAVVGVLGLLLFKTTGARLFWVLVSSGLVFLTGSRTAMAALAVALVWFAIRNRLPLLARLAVATVLVIALDFAERNLARIGIFEDRDGTDWLRAQIEAAALAKVDTAPWYGLGLSTADVAVGDRIFFFHNSYHALFVEGGYVLAGVMAFVFFILGLGLLSSRLSVDLNTRVAEAACVVILVCAWQLGEVFFTSVAALVLGFALWARFATPIGERVSGVSDLVARSDRHAMDSGTSGPGQYLLKLTHRGQDSRRAS